MSRLYLDHAATSPLRPEVRDAMDVASREAWGNPSSPHVEGRRARARLDEARTRIARSLGATTHRVVFTRGGTESDNLALFGRGHAGVPLISTLEHSAVRAPALQMYPRHTPSGGSATGSEPSPLTFPVAPSGATDPADLDRALSVTIEQWGADPGLRIGVVSLQFVNSETGIRPDLAPVQDWARHRGIPLHVDAVQAPGRVALPTGAALPELLTLSGHKLGGPRGIGVLLVGAGVELKPLLFGGRQEAGLRPGTEDVVGALGFAEALAMALAETETEAPRLARLRDDLERAVCEVFPLARVHGAEGARAPHILGVGIPGITSDLLLAALDLEGVAAAAGSACRTGLPGPGPALEALYGADAHTAAPLRLSLGWNTSTPEIEEAIQRIQRVLGRLPGANAPKRPPAPAHPHAPNVPV